MKNTSIKALAGLIAAIATGSLALADPIDGSVAFNGNASVSGTTIAFSSVVTDVGSGSYGGISSGDAVALESFSGIALNVTNINGQAFPVPGGTLWSFTDAGTGDSYSFVATSAIQSYGSINSSQWNFYGEGIASISGGDYSPTVGSWTIVTTNEGHDIFTFTGGSNVPDGGTTALLVGLGLLAMGGYALRNRRAKA